ncbi:MAG: hypothetical protein LBH76_07765 [Propionibacteriaceae bacterium]|jgi:hypothetical protein|nr:hypothetical protein [Propionibacteriaceae bacterium]
MPLMIVVLSPEEADFWTERGLQRRLKERPIRSAIVERLRVAAEAAGEPASALVEDRVDAAWMTLTVTPDGVAAYAPAAGPEDFWTESALPSEPAPAALADSRPAPSGPEPQVDRLSFPVWATPAAEASPLPSQKDAPPTAASPKTAQVTTPPAPEPSPLPNTAA